MARLVSFNAQVTTAGTAESIIAAGLPLYARWLQVVANPGNTGDVVIGSSTVVAAEATRTGILVSKTKTEGVFLPGPFNVGDIYADVLNDGDKLHFNFLQEDGSVSQLGDGRKTVASAGTPVRMVVSADLQVEWVRVTANSGNTGDMIVGGSDITMTEASRKGVLVPKSVTEGILIPGPLSLRDVYVDAANDNDQVHFAYLNKR